MAFDRISRRSMLKGTLSGGAIAYVSGLNGQAVAAPGSEKFTVVTLAGQIETPNRPAFSKAKDKLFTNHNIAFTLAFAFAREDLLQLPQMRVSAMTDDGSVGFEGPALADVVNVPGIKSEAKTLTIMALDGYFTTLSLADISSQGWVLALSVNAMPLGLGDLGPAYLVRDLGADLTRSEAEDAKWVHSIFYIEAKA
jgi:hypothetical protein